MNRRDRRNARRPADSGQVRDAAAVDAPRRVRALILGQPGQSTAGAARAWLARHIGSRPVWATAGRPAAGIRPTRGAATRVTP